MRPGAEEVVYSSSSSSSTSYIDISRTYPRKFGLLAFFTAPSERRRLRRRRSSRLFKIGNSSSSSVNSDLAYGTGFIKRSKRRGVRSRKGKEIGSERRDGVSDRENNRRTRGERRDEIGRPPLGRAQTDAEILAIGAGLAKLARDQNKKDLRDARNGIRPDLVAGNSAGGYNNQGQSRGLVNSRPSHGSDTVDEEGWESASESEESVDSRLAFGPESKSNGGFFGLFGRKKTRPLSRKDSVVDPRLFGPNNTLNGIVTEPVGFDEVTPWTSTNDFGQQLSDVPGIGPSHTGSQASLQRVYPVPTSDPGRFDARAASVASRPEPMVVSRPGPIPIQQPQPIAPISQSVYGRTESGSISKRDSTSGRGKSLAEAALVGVTGAAVGAAIASSRDDRKRREDEELDERNRLRRRDSEKESKDERRREKRNSPDREERREKRREKDESSRVSDKRRERRKDETREERDERRERRRDEPRDEKDERREKRRSERFDDGGEARRTKSETAVPTTVVDPFQYQVLDDAFPTPTTEPSQRRIETAPEVQYVTVEREPDFSRIAPIRDARTPDFMHMHRQNPPKYIDRDQGERDQDSRDRALHEAEEIYEETTHSTAPIAAAAFGAAVAAVHHADAERDSRSDKRRDERRGERRSDYDDYGSKGGDKKTEKERDPIQEEADRAYREIVMARKIASQVIRSRTPSPNRSVVEKYVEEEEEEPVRIVTPPGMEDKKKVGPYDAPDADFKLDHVLEDPVELQTFRVSPTNTVRVDAEGPYLKRDPDADRPRPFLNLVRPTPVPSPMPEKQATRSEPATSSKSKDREERKRSSNSDVQSPDEVVDSPTASNVSKGVTWGENETKHFEVESPSEHRDEFVSKSDIEAREAQEEAKPAAKPRPKSKGWGAIAAGIMGAGVGAAAAASSSETSKTSKSKEDEKKDAPYEYRGVVAESENTQQSSSQRSAPPTGPKPSNSETSRVPGAFDDDIDFTATVAAGLQDSGFDPNIVIDDPSFRRRDSPLGSNDFKPYRAPFAETVSDLGTIPSDVSGARGGQGFVLGEVASTPQDWRSVSPPREDETPTKLSKKEQKKRDKERRRSGDVTPLEESSATRDVVEEPESYFEPPLSKKEQKKRDKLARQNSQGDDITPSVAEEIVEEPENYFETPKKSKKKSKKGSSGVDDYAEDAPRDSRKVSVPVDAFDDLRNDDDEWADAKKSKKKSKRDSDRYDSPVRSVPSSEIASELERSSSKKSKDKSKRKSEQYDPDPTEISLPASTPSETSRDGEFDDSRGNRKSSTRDSDIFNSADRGDSRSVVSADTSRYDDDEPRKSKKKSRSSTKDDYEDSRSVVSAPAGDNYEESKRSKKKDKDKDKEKEKKSGGGFFGLFGSKSDVGARDESPKESKDDFEESKKKKKSKRSSVADSSSIYGDAGAQSVGDLSRSVSNGNGDRNGSYDDPDEEYDEDPGEKSKTRSRSESSSSKKDSFLGNAGTLGAGVGIAGAAVAIAAQQYQQSKAANANSRETVDHERSRSSPGSILPHEIYDPEITERQIRPSIDPQYGDFLPLPPSNPVSPNVDPIDDLPELPDSRPDTPEPERITREKSLSTVRKNTQETLMKSPSQSAVPLNFLMRNRSQPSSPRFVRSSPLQSPAAPNEDSLAFPRSRPRPTSWDSTKEYKPLYLVESHRRGSSAQLEMEEDLPALPPSQRTSRSSSQLELDELARDPLSIDTQLASSKSAEELLGSEQSTPKAAVMTRDGHDIDDSFHGTNLPTEFGVPSHTEHRTSSPEPKSHFGEHVAEAAAVAGLVSTIGYFASSPTHPKTKESFLDELPSVPRQPSPVDPMTKDRSSYLLQSSPMSRKFEEFESADRDLDSPSRKQKSSRSSSNAIESIEERKVADVYGSLKSTPQAVEHQREKAMDTLSGSPHDDLTDQENIIDSLDLHSKHVQDQEIAAPTVDEAEPADEFTFTKSKKDKKKDKKKGKVLSRSSTKDDFVIPESSSMAEEMAGPVEAEPADDEFFVTKSKKDKKKDKKKSKSMSAWEPEESESVAKQIEGPMLEITRDVSEEVAQPVDVEPVGEFSTPRSKKDKKKDKRKSVVAWEPEASESAAQTIDQAQQEPTRARSEDVSAPTNNEPVDEFFTTASKKDKKKDKKRGKAAWEPEEESISQPLPEPVTEESRGIPKDTTTPAEVEPSEDFSFTKSKKDKKKDKKRSKSASAVGSEKDENEAQALDTSQDLVEEPFPTSHQPSVYETTIKEQTGESTTVSHDYDDIAGPESMPKDSQLKTIEDNVREPSASDDFTAFETKKSKKKKGKSLVNWEQEDEAAVPNEAITQKDSSRDVPEAAPPADQFFVTKSKKSRKDKKKQIESVTAWEPEEEPASMPTAQEVDDGPYLEEATFKRGKKKNRKSSSFVPEDDLGSTSQPEPAKHHVSQDDIPGSIAVLKPEESQLPAQTSSATEQVNTREPENFLDAPESLSSKPTPMGGPGAWPITLATPWSGGEVPDSSSKEYFPSTETSHTPLSREILEDSQTKSYFPSVETVLPIVAAGAALLGAESLKKESSPASEELARDATISKSVDLNEPSIAQSDSKPTPDGFTAGYDNDQLSLAKRLQEEFSSGSKKSKKDKKRQSLPSTPARELSRSRTVEELPESHPRARSLSIAARAGSSPLSGERENIYGEGQLELARQLKADFESGSKKPRKDKKKRQGLSRSSTQDDTGFDRDMEDSQVTVPEVSKDSQDPDTLETVPKGDSFAAGYQEGQLSLARQLQAEFGKKSKKDKKRRSTSQTPQDQEPREDNFGEPSRAPISDVMERERTVQVPEASIQETARDGLAVGYNEEQLELARQLKEEFGSGSKKGKDKKDKKRRSASQTPLEQEPPDDYFGGSYQAPVLDEIEQDRGVSITDSNAGAGPARDGLAVGYKEEQLELARQLKEEFSSGSKKSKKDKKDKKRRSLLRSNTEGDFSSDAQQRDAERVNFETALESTEAGPTNEPEDESTFITKKSKKDKKGKKRTSLLPDTQGDDFPFETIPGAADDEVKPRDIDALSLAPFEQGPSEPVQQEDDFAFTKKSKKDKKGKKRDSVLQIAPDDELPSDTRLEGQNESRDAEVPTQPDFAQEFSAEPATAEPEDEFATSTKKSKKDKKSKKRDSVIRSATEEDISSDNFGKEVEALHAARDIEPQNIDFEPAQAAPEDDWSVPAKPSKKDKKKRQSTIAQEESLDRPNIEASPAQLEEELSTPNIASEAVNEPSDDFALSSKKSKKDKKKRGSLLRSSTFDETPAEQVKEIQPEPESRDLGGNDAGATVASLADDQDAGFEYSSKKSKKKRGSLLRSLTSDETPAEQAREVESESRDLGDDAGATAAPVAEDQDDEFEYSSKKLKKDKKKRGSLFRSSTFDETPAEQAKEEAQPEPKSRELGVDTIASLVDDQDDGFEYSSKKSKKDKKKRKSLQQTAVIEDLPKETGEPPKQDDAVPSTTAEDIRPSTLETDHAAEPAVREAAFDEDKSLNQPLSIKTEPDIPEMTTRETALDQDTSINQLEEPSTSGPPDIFHDFAFTTKKSKNDKKKRKNSTKDDSEEASGFSTPLDPMVEPRSIVESAIPVENDETAVFDQPLVRDLDSATLPASGQQDEEPADEWSSFTVKKSKKDKKRKGSSRTASVGPSGIPLEPIWEPEVATEDKQLPTHGLAEEAREFVEPPSQAIEEPPSQAVEEPPSQAIDEPPSQPVEEQPSQPVEEPPSQSIEEPPSQSVEEPPSQTIEEQPSQAVEEPPSQAIDEPPSQPVEEQPSQTIEELPSQSTEHPTSIVAGEDIEAPTDEWASFSTKKSKKDKKKSKSLSRSQSEGPSDISTLLKSIVEPEASMAVPSLSTENVPKDPLVSELPRESTKFTDIVTKDETDEPVDEWASFSTKKSKKDKKKRKSGLSTPAEPMVDIAAFKPERKFVEEPDQSARAEHDVPAVQAEDDLSRAFDDTPGILEPVTQDSKEQEGTDEAFAFVTKRSKKDKRGSKRSSRAPSESRATTSAPSDAYPREMGANTEPPIPSEQMVSSPVAMKDENLEDQPELQTDQPASDDDRKDTFGGGLFRTPSKKDKRKRQATLAEISLDDGMDASKPPLTSWADEVEEAEIERQIPVIQDIAKDESLSHIASTTESAPVDDFFRPTKKGKKGKKRISEPASSVESSRPATSSGMPMDELTGDQSNIAILAATGAALAGAALVSKGDEALETPSKSASATTPQRKLSKKEKKKKSIDLGPTPRDDIFDDPALWEGAEPKPHEEIRHVDDDAGSDGFGFASRDMDEPVSTREPYETREPTPGYDEHTHMAEARTVSPAAEAKFAPEESTRSDDGVRDFVPVDYLATAEPSPELRDLPRERQHEHHEPERFDESSSTRDEKHTQLPSSTYGPEEVIRYREDDQSVSQPHFSGSPRSIVDTPPSDRGVSFEELPPIMHEHTSTASRTSSEQPHSERSVAFEDVTDHSPARPLSTSKYGRTSFSDLPVVHEESEHLPPHPHHDFEGNRDSAFVTGSPIPRHQGFTDDHEHVRDSGVHLRDLSPAERVRTHVSSTDDALARLSWPQVDDETETVDLRRSQRPAVKTSTGHHQEKVPSETRDSHSHESHRAKGDKATDPYRSQRSTEERPSHHDKVLTSRDLFPSYKSTEERSVKHHEENASRDHLPSQHGSEERHTDLHRVPTIHESRKPREDSLVKQRLQRFESPDFERPTKPKEDKYAELATSQRPKAERPKGMSEVEAGAAIAGATLGFAAARKLSQEQRPPSAQSQRSSSNINRLRTPDPNRPDSVASNRSGTPPLRRSDRKLSGDLRSLSQRSKPDLAKEAELAALVSSTSASQVNTANPTANEGRVRAKDMATDVYVRFSSFDNTCDANSEQDGFGEGRMGSPRSPTRPHSMRRRQSMQVLDLESKVEQLAAENRMLTEAKAQAERTLASTSHSSTSLIEKDAEIDSLKRTLDWLQNEVTRLTQVNEGLNSAHVELGRQHNERYGVLESQHVQATRELQEVRDAHDNLSAGMEGIVRNEVQGAVQAKDREIAQLRAELDATKEQIREMQCQILTSKANEVDFLTVRDEDYFDNACQSLCQHVQQWVLRFSKFSDMRACRLSSEINNDKTIDRLDNAILDGSDVDNYLADRIRRRDVFMSMTMNMVWEFIFTRYLFGMDREQRQKLKSLEKTLSEVGPAAAVHHWRATTLTLLSKRDAFIHQREQDTQAVVHAIIETLSEILPPPSHLETQIEEQLTRVMKEAVDLSIEMRTQRAEYMMLPPLLPEYDANGDLASRFPFNAALMNERSGDTVSNEELEEQKAIVRIVLFPLVVKKGDDRGEGDEEIVVCPAQVLVAKPKKSVRVFSPGSVQGHSRVSLQSSMPADHGEGSVI
jgi:hypothetical protein